LFTDVYIVSIQIPCRTAMRGSFPLNGTYFQVNEVSLLKQYAHCTSSGAQLEILPA